MRTGETAHVSVDSLTLDGEGVAHVEARELRCRGVFPSERAAVRIEALSRHHPRAHARLITLEAPHRGRRRAPCPNHEAREGRCTGCALMALDEAAQREVKRTMLRERFGHEVARVTPAPAALGYRYSSKRVALSIGGRPHLGSFAYGSHTPARMDGCLVDHPRLVRAFAAVEDAVRAAGLSIYDERSGTGELRYVWGKTNGSAEIVTLVTAQPSERVRALVPALRDRVAGVLHSVQPSRGNNLRGGPATLLCGIADVSLALLGQRVEVGALGFLQPNPAVAEQAYRALTDLSDLPRPYALAFDLYAGAGITTAALRSQFGEVIACEAHPESAAALGVTPETVEQFLTRELARPGRRTPDLVIANPPRKGLGPDVCSALGELAAPTLRIMSCGPEGLARDLDILRGRYTIASLEAFDTLPQTPHVELVAKLTLRPASAGGPSAGG